MKNNLLALQNFLLTVGVLFAGYNVFLVIEKYISIDGLWTVFKMPNGLVNPLLTPCFWGFVVFLITFVWSIILRINYNKASQYKLIWLIALGAVFAWGNYGYELGRLYHNQVCNLGCAPGYFGIPQFTSCVVGAIIFTFALITAVKLRKSN